MSSTWKGVFEDHTDFALTLNRTEASDDLLRSAPAPTLAASFPLVPILACLPPTLLSLAVPYVTFKEFAFILDRFSSLRSLSIEVVPAEFFEALYGASKLNWSAASNVTHLSMNNVKFSGPSPEKDLAFLSHFPSLRQLKLVNKTLTYTEIESAQFLSTLVNLEELNLENFNLSPDASLSFLTAFTDLRSLNVPISESSLTVLSSLAKLSAISLYSLDAATLDCISKLPNVTTLDISACGPISRESILALANLTGLKTLFIDDRTFLEDSVQLLYPLISRTQAVHIVSKQYQMPPSRSWLSPIAPSRGPFTGGVGNLHSSGWSSYNNTVVGH